MLKSRYFLFETILFGTGKIYNKILFLITYPKHLIKLKMTLWQLIHKISGVISNNGMNSPKINYKLIKFFKKCFFKMYNYIKKKYFFI